MAIKAKKKAKKITVPFRLRVIDFVVALATVFLIAVGVWATIYRSQDDQGLACVKPGAVHRVVLSGDSFSPNTLTVRRCDSIIVTNMGERTYELVFGDHDNLSSYPGFSQQRLQTHEYFELEAVQSGNYVLHDHHSNRAYLRLQVDD